MPPDLVDLATAAPSDGSLAARPTSCSTGPGCGCGSWPPGADAVVFSWSRPARPGDARPLLTACSVRASAPLSPGAGTSRWSRSSASADSAVWRSSWAVGHGPWWTGCGPDDGPGRDRHPVADQRRSAGPRRVDTGTTAGRRHVPGSRDVAVRHTGGERGARRRARAKRWTRHDWWQRVRQRPVPRGRGPHGALPRRRPGRRRPTRRRSRPPATQRGSTTGTRKGNGTKSAGGGRKNGNGTASPVR